MFGHTGLEAWTVVVRAVRVSKSLRIQSICSWNGPCSFSTVKLAENDVSELEFPNPESS